MQTLDDIKSELRGLIGRGTSQDSNLISYIRKAVNEIERRRKFLYMYHLFEVQNNPSADLPRTLQIPSWDVRSIDFMRITEEEGEALLEFVTLNKVTDLKKLDPPLEGQPTQYILTQSRLITFNNTPLLTYTFEGGWWVYSSITDDAAFEHWLFDNFTDGLIDMAMHFSAKATRDWERAGLMRQSALSKLDDLISAEEDREFEDAEIVMQRDFYSEHMG